MGIFNKSLNAIKGIAKEHHQNMGAKPVDYAIGGVVGAVGNLGITPWWSDKDSPYTNAISGAIGGALAGGMARKVWNHKSMSNIRNDWERHYNK